MSETDKINYLNFTGCSQQNRYSRALDTEYVKIDERSFTDNLVYSLGLSKLLNYYNIHNRPDGDWSEFLTDEAVILSAISFIKPAEFEDKFKRNVYKSISFIKPDKKLKYLRVCFEEIFKVARKIDTWYQHLKHVEDFQQSELQIRNEISNVVDTKLRSGLQKFYSFVIAAKEEDTIHSVFNFNFESFSFIWQLEKVKASGAIYNGETLQQRIDSAAEALQNIFQLFYESVIYIRQKALTSLDFSLSQDNHYPEVALLLTFLKLYEYPQANINKLTGRYLDYYYRNVLRQSERNAEDDKAFLTFVLDKEACEAIVPKGAQFIAGTDDDGKNVFYSADEEIFLNKAKLVKMNNLYVARKSLNLDGEIVQRVSNLYKSSIPVIDWIEKPSLSKRMSYPTFGEDQEGLGNYDTTMEHARLGMAISSPALLLAEGKRELTIRIQLKEDAYNKLESQIKNVGKELACSFKEAIAKSLLDSLSISLTSNEGWLDVRNNIVTIERATNSLLIKFDVEPDKPSIVSFDSKLHGSEFDSDFPVMRLVLNNESYIYPYSLLSEVEVDQVIIHAKVLGVKNLLLHNNVGAVNANAPFYPFGPVPKVGSFLVIGNNEIFQKQLEDLKINLEWFELPQESNGFKDYYKDYRLNVDNASYEVSVSVLENGKWMPEEVDAKQKLKLFRTVDKPESVTPSPKHRLFTETRFNNIDMDLLRMVPDFRSINEKPQYTSMSKRGFLKLELINPVHAFGHDVYPAIVSDITLENSKSGFLKGKTKKDLPRSAFTPQVRSISVDYESISVISMKENFTTEEENAAGKIFHLHPFGCTKVFPNKSIKQINIIPSYDAQGELYLGLANVNPPQQVSLLFEMLDEFNISSEEEPPVLDWYFLSNDKWTVLKPSNILRDDTNNFLKTGIVVISLPDAINQNNTVLSNDLFWLKVSVKKNIEVASRNLSVASQVGLVTLIGNDKLHRSNYLDKPIPRYKIQRSVKSIKGVRSVIQPLPSFGGISHEKEKEFQARIGERLKHRNRAITAWDFERLILDRYKQIEKAVCLPNMTSNSLNAPGNVLMVVSPFPATVLNSKEPKASSELLFDIKSYIQKHASPFARIEVRNPSYERIRIICSVQFSGSHNNGFYIQKLNEDINNYLSGNIGSMSLGTQMDKVIYCSDVITYLRTLPYVEYITKFSMVQAARNITGNYELIDTAEEGKGKGGLQATKPWSVLVPADYHQFTILSDKHDEDSAQAGIDYLELGSDFIIKV
ncbi:MAG: hypothetical protein C0599_02580 [Salinivirgaceae bacterium]|nr:MAG: hypothetical protein C0599_02580 [Salinivirgaceae bacterium]